MHEIAAVGCQITAKNFRYRLANWRFMHERMNSMLLLAITFIVGVAAGYAIREMVSRHHRQLARSTFRYPE